MNAHRKMPNEARKGRGATANPTGRFEPRQRHRIDDGWGILEEEPPRLATQVVPERTRHPLTTNDSPDVPFEVSINPYKGCEHGCVYCFARPTHAYLGLSPGLDFETRIFSRPDIPQQLRRKFRRRSYQPKVIALGANTDPYQPVERDLRITRAILEVMVEFRHPVGLVTKSQSVLRDLDLLTQLAEDRLVQVMISVTTLDAELAQRMEPRATSPTGRVETLRRLRAAGVPTGVLASPMIPGLNDAELDGILEACAGAGATSAGYILLRLPGEVKELFLDWLEHHYPQRKAKVVARLREAHGGALYRSEFGTRMRGDGVYAQMIEQRFLTACRRWGLDPRGEDLAVNEFRIPPRAGENLSLF